MSSELERTAAAFRAAMLADDQRIAGDLVAAFAAVWRRLRSEVDGLTRQIEAARIAGETVNPAWLQRQTRYYALLAQAEREILRYAHYASAVILNAQRDAINAAIINAPDLLSAALGSRGGVSIEFNHLPREAFLDLVGTLQDGSPLRSLLDEMGPQASAAVQRVLMEGLALGKNPNVIAAQIQAALGGSAVRAMTIARTEILRSYRTSSLRLFQANSSVVQGWIWSADPGSGTCAMCWAMDGSTHGLDEQMDTHPRCRCAMLPWTRSWADLGFPDVPDSAPSIEPGEERFARLPAADQRQILGPGKYAAYRDGRIALSDLVQPTQSAQWGAGRTEASLSQALANAGSEEP